MTRVAKVSRISGDAALRAWVDTHAPYPTGFGGFGCLGFGGLFGVLSPMSHLQSQGYDLPRCLWANLQAGHCAVLDGKPVKVADPVGPARSMQSKDPRWPHAGHCAPAKPSRTLVACS